MGYSLVNLVAFTLTGFGCISIVVFMSATQPYLIGQKVHGVDPSRMGSLIGNLGFFDELVSIASAPVFGIIVDRINSSPRWAIGGTKVVEPVSFLIVSTALVLYGTSVNKIHLYISRMVFALGVTGVLSLITVLLNELSTSGFSLMSLRSGYQPVELASEPVEQVNEEEVSLRPFVKTEATRKNGTFSALIGVATGLGAVFAASALLPLPMYFKKIFPEITTSKSLEYSYLTIAIYGALISSFLARFLFNLKKLNVGEDEESQDVAQGHHQTSDQTYFELLQRGYELSKEIPEIRLSYLGSFVVRASNVATSIFIPVLVFDYFYKNGTCDTNATGKENCEEAYIFLAMLTGIAQTFGLLSSPVWAKIVNKHSNAYAMYWSAILMAIGNLGLCFHFWFQLFVSEQGFYYSPKQVVTFLTIIVAHIGQFGLIMTSMGLLSQSAGHAHVGSVSGLQSLCGSFGILIISKFGGWWTTSWILGPFFVLGIFSLILVFSIKKVDLSVFY